MMLDFKKFVYSYFHFYGALKFLYDPHYTLTNLPFLRLTISIESSQLRISSCHSPIVAQDTLDLIIQTLEDFPIYSWSAIQV
jgi:hypothetical protein